MTKRKAADQQWLPAGLALMMVCWGANQFASLMTLYRLEYGVSELTVTAMLGIYVVGLVPALLIGGPLSDRQGRRPLTLIAVWGAFGASLIMLFGSLNFGLLFLGRFLAGVATGAGLAATSSWIKELSHSSNRGSSVDAGARRSSLLATAGFWAGPTVAGSLAYGLPLPELLPYALHLVLTAPFLFLVARLPETRIVRSVAPTKKRLLVSCVKDPRFLWVVGPSAPWAFAAGSIGFAVIPTLIPHLHGRQLLYGTGTTALTLGTGVLVQSLARRLDSHCSARATLVSLVTVLAGLLTAAAAATSQNPWVGVSASVVLGAGYGLLLASSLLEVQRIAPPHELGGLTGIFYTLAYIGFLAPTMLALCATWVPKTALLLAAAGLCIIPTTSVLVNYRRHLQT